MIDFAAFQFTHPALLLLLPPLWALLWLLRRYNRRQSTWNRVCDPHLLDNMSLSDSGTDRQNRLIRPLALVLTLGLLAAAGPGWRAHSGPAMESASARIIALDLSQAMRVQDVAPDRFTQAVAAVRQIIAGDFDGETGLLVYAGAAFVLSPLSRDANTLLAFVDALEPGLLPVEGSRLDLAIERAQDLLLASISGRGQIIIVGGGADHPAQALQAAFNARGRGHQVSILAIGSRAGAPLIDSDGAIKRDGSGELILARTDFDALEKIAQAGGGLLLGINDTAAHDELLASRISADVLIETGFETSAVKHAIANEGYWLIWLALPFVLLLFRRNLFWLILVVLLLPQTDDAVADDTGWLWQHRESRAYNAYLQGSFERSAELTRAPLLRGAAHYRAGNYPQALEAFAQGDSALAHFNRGNTLVQLERLPEALVAYQQALELNPKLTAARYNKRLLEHYREQRQQSAGTTDAADETDPGDLEAREQAAGEARLGATGQQMPNPGDQQRLESGFGASARVGQIDPFEQFDGREQQPDRFSLRDGITRMQADIYVESWVNRLPSASADLFRRKFIRDYQRQRQQTR